jgi:two-component system, NarL family, invasion response regulator UvrY
MTKILIGDDHRIVREGLKQMLADAPDLQVVGEAQTGVEVLALVPTLGWTFCRSCAKHGPHCPC